MNQREKNIALFCDGLRTSKEIALLADDNAKYVQRTMKKHNLPRRKQGAQKGDYNGSWSGGRIVDLDGYATVPTPDGFQGRKSGRISEHRLIMAQTLGRDLLPEEVVDHIDGLHLHNDPSNLRLFASNAEHLNATIRGQIPRWSQAGVDRMNSTFAQRSESQHVDTYRHRKASGDVRLQQILLAALQLGIDSPFLSGTIHHLEKAEISDLSHSSLKRALGALYQRYE